MRRLPLQLHDTALLFLSARSVASLTFTGQLLQDCSLSVSFSPLSTPPSPWPPLCVGTFQHSRMPGDHRCRRRSPTRSGYVGAWTGMKFVYAVQVSTNHEVHDTCAQQCERVKSTPTLVRWSGPHRTASETASNTCRPNH